MIGMKCIKGLTIKKRAEYEIKLMLTQSQLGIFSSALFDTVNAAKCDLSDEQISLFVELYNLLPHEEEETR